MEFRKIPGYELYEVNEYGTIRNARTLKELSTRVNSQGYVTVSVYQDGKKKMPFVSHLVALAWVPNVQKYKYVNHLDGDKTNVSARNLVWVAAPPNMCRRVVNLDTGEEFDSVREAAASCYVDEDCLRRCCRGLSKTSAGYKWAYID